MPADRPFTILMLGDVFGKPGRRALATHLGDLVAEHRADAVVVNVENASGGLGLTIDTAHELLRLPIAVMTTGNHIWKHREIADFLASEERIIRPANYPEGTPGRGWTVVQVESVRIGVINLQGLLFMDALPCPFKTASDLAAALRKQADIILVDFHAEATSEKRALGHFLDGKVTAVVGTHTHIPTADAEVLPNGTGYLTDLGMCGPTDSVIGVRKEMAIRRFVTRLPSPFQVASDGLQLQGALISADPTTGRCLDIRQISKRVGVPE